MLKSKTRNPKREAQAVVEYLLLFAAVIAILLWFLNTQYHRTLITVYTQTGNHIPGTSVPGMGGPFPIIGTGPTAASPGNSGPGSSGPGSSGPGSSGPGTICACGNCDGNCDYGEELCNGAGEDCDPFNCRGPGCVATPY